MKISNIIFIALIINASAITAQGDLLCKPIFTQQQSIGDLEQAQIIQILSTWKIDTLVIKNYKVDLLTMDTVHQLITRCEDPILKKKALREQLKFWEFYKKENDIIRIKNEIDDIENEMFQSQLTNINQQNDSLKNEIAKIQSKAAFNAELMNQTSTEKKLWFYISMGLGIFLFVLALALIVVIRRKPRKGPVEKEIVIKEQKVVVHEPHPDHAESAAKIAELEKLYRNSLQTIHLQEGEKKESQAKLIQIVDILREAQQDLKKIQENKQMTAEDFMRLSNAVQRSISNLSSH